MDMSTASAPSSDRLPPWLAEALDVLSARRRLVVATAIGLVLLGGIVALLLPSVLPAQAIVGAAVGLASALLATALALALDASDLVVRGTRHVHAAGGTVDVRVGRQHDDVGPLLAAVARHAPDGQVRVALSPASRTAGVPGARAAALAEALARTGRKVLLTDLTRGGTPAAGLSDVIAGSRSLAEVVRFEQELYLARLAVGSDPDTAIGGFAAWAESLPSDLEVLVAALPPLADRGVLGAAGAMDLTLVLVEVDRTERVDLIASLDAVDASHLTSELVLVDPHRTVGEPAPAPPQEAQPADELPDVDDHDVGNRDVDDRDVDGLGEDEPVVAPVETDAPETHLEPVEAPLAGPSLPAAAGPVATSLPPGAPPTDDGADDEPAPDVALDLFRDADDQSPVDAAAASGPLPTEPAQEDEPIDEGPTDEEPTEGGDPAADATAEILMPHDPSRDQLSAIWGDPTDRDAAPAPEPDGDTESVPDSSRGPHLEPPPTPEPSLTPEPSPDPGSEPAPEPEPEPDPRPEPAPSPAPAPERAAAADETGLDPAALEVARTSAALHQLAQQIWDRDDG